MIGILIGTLVGLIIAVMPAFLALFSKSCTLKYRVYWFVVLLVLPFVVKLIANLTLHKVQGHVGPYGNSFIAPLLWYVTAWGGFIFFRKNYCNNTNVQPKS